MKKNLAVSVHKQGIYEKYIKRGLDFVLSLFALIVLFPILLILAIIGAVAMGGSPFFTQERPGKDEKIFKLIKFRTMTNKKDANGKLLPDKQRLTKYGKFLRATSLDELPELWNILKGDLSICGPRPLLVSYLPYYTDRERLRHSVRPGLSGLAQVSGRNFIGWDQRLEKDVEYVENISFLLDVKIIWKTVVQVFKHEAIAVDTSQVESNFAEERKSKLAM